MVVFPMCRAIQSRTIANAHTHMHTETCILQASKQFIHGRGRPHPDLISSTLIPYIQAFVHNNMIITIIRSRNALSTYSPE